MKKIIVLVLVMISFFACKKEQQDTRNTQTESREDFLAKNKLTIPKKGKLKELTPIQKKLVQDWLEFKTVHESTKLINASTRFAIVEDLGQLAANIDAMEQKRFPKELDVMQIRSRFLVLKTKALKLQDDATDENISNEFIEKEIVEINKVFNAICYQIEQASALNITPEEILGDAFKTKDSTEAVMNKEQKPAQKLPKKQFKQVELEKN
ncbi:hypothetical protein H2O64_21820 [Kordia sp. YSTF-M3]|uniref:Lipoprotein n=1 Tax=Kordia aestuariivivens TaxID=2759037 RepID=A0ABR7QFH4_9FLAO|nr:hypothetical protein [Kordia aestuariivivens]MBC8757322.1 hypothetical protein [Kordia aestuariivivens]